MGAARVLVGFEVSGDIGVLSFNRPEVLNALDIATARELAARTAELRQRAGVRALIITGSGRAFCAGGDLGSFRLPRGQMKAQSLEITALLHGAIVDLARMDLPVVAAVNGVAAGAGLALACACDLVVAAQSAAFLAAYTLAGLSPDLGLTHTLPRLIGRSTARSLILGNRKLSAAEARELGLVHEVVPDGEAVAAARRLCERILAGSPAAIGATKRLLADGEARGLEEQLAAERESLAELAASAEAYARCARFAK